MNNSPQLPTRVNVFDYDDHKAYLRDAYEQRKALDYHFSHRYIAAKLGLESSAMFLHILHGKVRLSERLTSELIRLFAMKKREATYFRLLVDFHQARNSEEKRRRLADVTDFLRNRIKVDEERDYVYHEHWYHAAICNLVKFSSVKEDAEGLNKKLSPTLSAGKASRAVQLLLKLGYLRSTPSGTLRPADKVPPMETEADKVALTEYEVQMLELARPALDRYPEADRKMAAVTVSASEETLEKVKDEIQKCRDKIEKLCAEDAKPNRVYQVNMQLFPLTKK